MRLKTLLTPLLARVFCATGLAAAPDGGVRAGGQARRLYEHGLYDQARR